MSGGFGDDLISGGEDDDLLFGGRGEDVAQYSQGQHDYIFKGHPAEFQVIGEEGRDTLKLEFKDGTAETDSIDFLPALFARDCTG